MMRRGLLNTNFNAGLVNLAGAGGAGFAKAGAALSGYGDDKIKAAEKLAADKEKAAMLGANAKYNTIVNPDAANLFVSKYDTPEKGNEALGLVKLSTPEKKEGYTLGEGQTRFDANGNKISSNPKTTDPVKVSKTVVDSNDFVHLVYADGSTKKTGIKSKDWQKSGRGSNKDGVPDDYEFAGKYNISDELDYELATSGAYMTDKNGVRYVNKAKYKNLIDLGNTEVK